MRLALAQINPTVGDISGNAALIERALEAARKRSVDLVVFPELSICGYPPRDLLQHEGFVEACERETERIGTTGTRDLTVVMGTPLRVGGAPEAGSRLANSLVVYRGNEQIAYYDKRLLPTYDVFDEDRYFEAGDRAVVIDVAGERVGLAICEDLWQGRDAGFSSAYDDACRARKPRKSGASSLWPSKPHEMMMRSGQKARTALTTWRSNCSM